MPEDSQFPLVAMNLPEGVKYTSLWVTKDAQHIKDSKIFWILMEMNIHMTINHKPRLSPSVFDKLQEYTEFKENFQHISIRAWKDPEQTGHEFPYLATDDTIGVVLGRWPTEWRTASHLVAGSSNSIAQ